MASPWVQRMVKEQQQTGRKASVKPEPTLGDKVAADAEQARNRRHLAAFMGDCKVPSCDVCLPNR